MAHLHTGPNGHDLTASAFIFRERDDDVEVLVHLHRKLGLLLQPGGHVEHDENPWQALEHELREETGYALDQLLVLQPLPPLVGLVHDNLHPTPALLNTHEIGTGHFHTDLCFALVADDAPRHAIAEGESLDLRWLSVDELAAAPEAPPDVVAEVRMLVERVVPTWHRIPAGAWRLD
ncbi:MAG: NUDIX domain-containing protein [Propionibacterium sp.]|nr:NUDIX domain-containing protein [Propionibacterium sp.]